MGKAHLAAAALALSLALGACGGGDVPGTGNTEFEDAHSLVSAAKRETENSKSSSFHFTVDVAGQKMTGSGQGQYDGPESAMSMTMDMGGQKLEMRYVDKVAYLKMPPGMPGAQPGKPWMKITPDGHDQLSQMLGNIDQLVEQNDPTKVLEQIDKAGTVSRHEKTQVDGQDATQYWIDLNLAKLAAQSPIGMSAESLEQLERAGVKSLPMQLALNEGSLPIRIQLDLTQAIQAAAKQSGAKAPAGKALMTMTYRDWGKPVTVEAPAAAEVAEMPK